MLSDRKSRLTSFNSFDTATGFRRISRMNTNPSMDRMSSFDRPVLSHHKSVMDLSALSYETSSSVGISSPIVHRNSSFQRVRSDVWRKAENRKLFANKKSFHSSRPDLHSFDNISSTTQSSKANIRSFDPISVLDRRDHFFSQLNAMSSPKVGRRGGPQLSNIRSNLIGLRQWPKINSSEESYGNRPRIRDRPLLSKLSQRYKLSPKSSPTSSTKVEDSISIGEKKGSTGIYRNRYIIKFREHNLGQTSSQRRSSITWDLPKSYTTVKVSDETPIIEDLESEKQLETKSAESESHKQKESVFETVNESDLSSNHNKEIKIEEKPKGLVSDQEIITKRIANELQPTCNTSQLVIDILPIHTAVMPEPSGTQSPTAPHQQKAVLLKSKTINETNVENVINAVNVPESKSPKKKKVKKKEPKNKTKDDSIKEKVEKSKDIQQESVVKNQENLKIDKNVENDKNDQDKESKVVIQVRKDINENILNERDLSEKKNNSLVSIPKKIKFRKYTIDDFVLLKVLGRGSFGKVFLAELKDHNIHFAIKCLKKHSVIEDDDIESIMIERKVLAFGSSHPFICKLFCTFQTESYLCFTMEWCCGGDLMFHVQKLGKFDENKARFYASEILCAVKFMHNKGIIYRDLKLDNIMIDSKGHLRLVDFGMCQGRIYREDLLPSNFCGTPEYMAPEIIKGVKYNQSVDFWSFGVLLYEMVVGTSPFHGTDEDELLWNVCHQEVHYPLYLSENIKSLLVLLLNKCPEQRLGMSTCTAGDIFSQPFFRSIDWVKVEKCQIKPPFVPELSSPSDVSYFESYFTKEEPNLTPVSEEITISMDQTVFQGFSYTNHNMTD